MESLLAQRNLQKQIAPLLDVARLGEAKRSNLADEGQRTQDRAEQAKYREAVQAQTQAERDRMAEERKIDNRRASFTATRASLKPGDRITDPNVVGLISEFEGGDQLTPDEQDPTSHIYRQRDFKIAEAHREAEEAKAKMLADRQKHDDMLKDKADARAEKDQKHQDATAERAQKLYEKKVKDAAAVTKDIPISLRPAIKTRADQIIKEHESMFAGYPGFDPEMNKLDAWMQAAAEVKEKGQANGLMPVTGPVVAPPATSAGRGAGPGAGGPPAKKTIKYDMDGKVIGGSGE